MSELIDRLSHWRLGLLRQLLMRLPTSTEIDRKAIADAIADACGRIAALEAQLAARTGGVKTLDLSNLLRHAFFAGFMNAGGSQEAAAEWWPKYDPETCPAYSRILSALEATPAPEQRELSAEDVATFDRALLRSGQKAKTTPPAPKVTEAMVEVAAKAVVAEWQKMVAETSPHMSPGDHARAFVSPGNYRLIRAALTAAQEEGR